MGETLRRRDPFVLHDATERRLLRLLDEFDVPLIRLLRLIRWRFAPVNSLPCLSLLSPPLPSLPAPTNTSHHTPYLWGAKAAELASSSLPAHREGTLHNHQPPTPRAPHSAPQAPHPKPKPRSPHPYRCYGKIPYKARTMKSTARISVSPQWFLLLGFPKGSYDWAPTGPSTTSKPEEHHTINADCPARGGYG